MSSGYEVQVTSAETGGKMRLRFFLEGKVGVGTFGSVYRVKTPKGTILAFKEQRIDRKTKFREVAMSLHMNHPNLIKLFYYKVKPNRYCLTFMEYMPSSLSQVIRKHSEEKTQFSLVKQRVYMFQILRGLAFMHRRGIAHRDIKSDNIVVNDDTSELKICDFGSAKILNDGTNNLSYICSRWYRAPELLMGSKKYTVKVDVWSTGCILLELIKLKACFKGKDSMHQLTKYVSKLGPFSDEDLKDIGTETDYSFLRDSSCNEESAITIDDAETCGFAACLLQYSPASRIAAWDALFHRYFANIRFRSRFSDDGELPPLFNWTEEERKFIPTYAEEL